MFKSAGALFGWWVEPLIEAQSSGLREGLSTLSVPKRRKTILQQMRLNVTGHRKLPPFQSHHLIGTDTPRTACLTVNPSCESKVSKIQEQIFDRLRFPGTYNEYYTMEGHEVQLTGGQYVTAGFVRKHKRNPCKTMKSALITECLQCDIDDLKPLLKLRVELEVSACTSNAQRVTLWDAMLLTHAKQLSSSANNQCHHPTADSKCLQTCWTRACSADDSVTPQPLIEDVQAREIMVKALLALQNTGIDPNNNMQVLWPFSEAAMTYRIEPTT